MLSASSKKLHEQMEHAPPSQHHSAQDPCVDKLDQERANPFSNADMNESTLPINHFKPEQLSEPNPHRFNGDQSLNSTEQRSATTRPYALNDNTNHTLELSDSHLVDTSKHCNLNKNAVTTSSSMGPRKKVYPRHAHPPGSEEETKLKVIHAIEQNWGKGFITEYITKCHCPHQKTMNGKRMTHRRFVTDPKKWKLPILKGILQISHLTDDRGLIKKATRDVVSYRIKNTNNRKPQLMTTDLEIVEDIIIRGWDVEKSFPIRYKHLMGHSKIHAVTDEDVDRILEYSNDDEMLSPEGESDVDAAEITNELDNARANDSGPYETNQASASIQKSKRPNLIQDKRQIETTNDVQRRDKGIQTDPQLPYHMPMYGSGMPVLGSIPYLSPQMSSWLTINQAPYFIMPLYYGPSHTLSHAETSPLAAPPLPSMYPLPSFGFVLGYPPQHGAHIDVAANNNNQPATDQGSGHHQAPPHNPGPAPKRQAQTHTTLQPLSISDTLPNVQQSATIRPMGMLPSARPQDHKIPQPLSISDDLANVQESARSPRMGLPSTVSIQSNVVPVSRTARPIFAGQLDWSSSVLSTTNSSSHNVSDQASAKRFKPEANSSNRSLTTKPYVTVSPTSKQKAGAESLSNQDRLRREIAEQERHVEFLRARHANLAQRKRS